MTREIRNSFKFCHVGPASWWHDALRPLVRIARFLPASQPVQRNSVEVTSKFRPFHLPWWRLTSHTLIVRHGYCPAVAVSSHNLPCGTKFLPELFLRIGDFLYFAGTNFYDKYRLVFLAGK